MTIPAILAALAIGAAAIIIVFRVIFLTIHYFVVDRPYQKWVNDEKAFKKFVNEVNPIIREK
jgi:hypothetical protein